MIIPRGWQMSSSKEGCTPEGISGHYADWCPWLHSCVGPMASNPLYDATCCLDSPWSGGPVTLISLIVMRITHHTFNQATQFWSSNTLWVTKNVQYCFPRLRPVLCPSRGWLLLCTSLFNIVQQQSWTMPFRQYRPSCFERNSDRHVQTFMILCRGKVSFHIVSGWLLDVGNGFWGAVRLFVLQEALEEELDLLGGDVEGDGPLKQPPDSCALSLLDLLWQHNHVINSVLRKLQKNWNQPPDSCDFSLLDFLWQHNHVINSVQRKLQKIWNKPPDSFALPQLDLLWQQRLRLNFRRHKFTVKIETSPWILCSLPAWIHTAIVAQPQL